MPDRDDPLDELGRLWRDQPTPSHPIEEDQMLTQVKQDARAFDRTLFWRDTREIVAAVAVLVFMGWRSFSEPGWLPVAGFAFAAACMALTVGSMLRARRHHRPAAEDATLVERLQAEVRKVEVQAELLRGVVGWYLAPIAIGTTVWLITADPPRAGRLLPVLAGIVGLFGVTGWLVWKLNQSALKTQLRPRLEELRRLLDQARAGEA